MKIRLYCQSKEAYYEGYVDEETAYHSKKIPVPEIIGLKFHSVIEGEKMKESGDIEMKDCCVDNRMTINEDGKNIVIINAHFC